MTDISIADGLRRAQRVTAALYTERNPGGLTLPQMAILEALILYGPQSQSQLVRRTAIDRSTMTTMLPVMVRNLWIARVKNEADPRAKIVSHTPAGRLAFKKAMVALNRAEIVALEAVAVKDRTPLRRALSAIAGLDGGMG